MAGDSTTRFSSRVKDYAKYRPGYPAAIADLFRDARVVADVGSGTGLLAKVFLEAGTTVFGVEPNKEMREAGDAFLSGFKTFQSVDGRAEATGLADHSVDLIVAGQAFHWFDVEATRKEWSRILRPGGAIALIWNERSHEGPFMRALGQLVDRFAHERDPDGSIREAGRSRIAGFFAPLEVKLTEFPNQQQFDLEGLRGRVFSSSYLPAEGEPGADALAREIQELFDRYQEGGRVTFVYRTRVYWAYSGVNG